MAKKRSTGSDQGRLFSVSVPTMPEGYYSGDQPNPNLQAFVEAHVQERPYDPETDDYDVPAFNKPLTVKNRRDPLNDLHIYWSKKPYQAIREYIRYYANPGDIILDPFCGSGGTALAALMEGCKVIAIDRSPAATFITRNYCTPVDVDKLQVAFEEIKRKVKPGIDWLYETRCDRCEGIATTAYIVHSKVFQCLRCLQKVPLFDCIDVENLVKDKIKQIKVCPYCFNNGKIEDVNSREENTDFIPVEVSYVCESCCKPSRGRRLYNDPNKKKREYFERCDLSKIYEIDNDEIPFWYPKFRMMHAPEDQDRWGLLWRPYLKGINSVDNFYTKRSLWALSIILKEIERIELQIDQKHDLLFCLSGSLYNATKMYQHRKAGGGPAKGIYYVPPIFREVSVWTLFLEKVTNRLRSSEVWRPLGKSLPIMISTQSATSLTSIKDSSIDYIFTDPPYSWKVQYGESNFLWEAWLRFDTRWHNEEIIVNEFRKKTELHWTAMMRQAMAECYRVLKPGRWLSLCYHDTSEGTWELVQDIMAEIGFLTDRSDSALFIDTGQKAWKQIVADKVNKRDLVINFRKPKAGETVSQVHITSSEDETTFNDKVRMIIRDYLTSHPGATKDRIYDEVVSRMVRAGRMEAHNFEELLVQVADEIREPVRKNLFEPADPDLFGTHEIRRWYLKETESGAEESERALEGTTANRIEALLIREATAAWRKSQPEWDSLKHREAEITKTLEAVQEDKPARRRLGRELRDITHRLQQLDAQRAEWQQHALHYTQIYECYLPLSPKPKITLFELLADYFYQTAEGNWRPPADDSERQAKATLRTQATRRRLQRFCRLIEAGDAIPQDMQPRSATLAEWIRHCKRAGFFAQGKLLYEKGGLNLDDLSEEDMVNVEEDYQVCVRELTRVGANQGKSRTTPRRR